MIKVSLSPEGNIIATLVGPTGAQHSVKLAPGQAEQALITMLQQEANKPKLGSLGAPTQAQANHDAKHGQFPEPRCPFCRQEGRFDHGTERTSRYSMVVHSGDVTIRQLAPRGKAKPKRQVALTLEDLGL